MPGEVAIALVTIAVVVAVFVSVRVRVAQGELAASFTGVVLDRRVEEVALTSGIRQDHWLVVRADGGDVVHVPVSPRVYRRFAAGDRIVKRAGVRWPEPG